MSKKTDVTKANLIEARSKLVHTAETLQRLVALNTTGMTNEQMVDHEVEIARLGQRQDEQHRHYNGLVSQYIQNSTSEVAG